MKILLIIVWCVFDAFMLWGAGIAFQRCLKNALVGKGGKLRFTEHVRKLTDEGVPRADAMELIIAKRRCAKLNAISYAAIMLVFIYIFVDVIFRHIF